MKTKNLEDSDLVRKINDRIKWDIRVNTSDVLIEAHHGRVTLSGYFDKSYRHSAAVEIINSTDGVKDLEDLSKVVADYVRTDSELKILIERQLHMFLMLPGEWIEVAVTDGVVKLEGVVFRPRLKAFAASDSWGLSGIQDCINLIEVKGPPTPARIRQWFKAPIARHLSFEEALSAAGADC